MRVPMVRREQKVIQPFAEEVITPVSRRKRSIALMREPT